jgi:hypothetical protein
MKTCMFIRALNIYRRKKCFAQTSHKKVKQFHVQYTFYVKYYGLREKVIKVSRIRQNYHFICTFYELL